jgi:hypothetical protein
MTSPSDNTISPSDNMTSPPDNMRSPFDNTTSPSDNMISPSDNMTSPSDKNRWLKSLGDVGYVLFEQASYFFSGMNTLLAS